MDIKNVLENIIYIPIKFRMPGSKESMYSLLKESGYFETYDQIDEDMLFDALSFHMECCYAWLFYSEDQRTDRAWYFEQKDHGKYKVGYFPRKENSEVTEYPDIRMACAAFIKHQIEDIRKI